MRKLFVVILVVTVIFLTTGYSYAFRDNIVAAWPLDEESGNDIPDASGKGNNGELIGGAEWIEGKFGNALHFDGSSNYIEVPFDESLKVINQGDFTFATWLKPDVISRKQCVFQQADGNGTGRTWLFIEASDNEIRSFLGGAPTRSGIIVEVEEWYHVSVVVTEGEGTDTVQLYVNGEPEGAPFQSAMEDCEGVFLIGCCKNLGNFTDGVIDDVVLINKALGEDEIADLMTNGAVGAVAVAPVGKLTTTWGGIKREY